jgi:hypothetical protein
MRALTVVIALAIATLVMVGVKRKSLTHPVPVTETSTERAPTSTAVIELKSPQFNRVAVPTPPAEVVPSMESKAPVGPDGFQTITDPSEIEVRKKVIKHMDLRYLESSPAKDTPEAKAIQDILAKHGIHRAAVPLCYALAWNYHQALKISGDAQFAEQSVMFDKEKLRRYGYGNVGDDFWQEVFAVKPVVFFGEKDYTTPREGEVLLTE